MVLSESVLDLLRGFHLVFFAAGMGTSLYFDFRTLYRIEKPVLEEELVTLQAIHSWITAAFIALWITGISLIYVRTGFVLDTFSPKLWSKVIIMVIMVINAVAIAKIVLPQMKASLGTSLLSLPAGKLALVTQIAIVSMFCWSSGLALGSSTVLKAAQWDLLIPLGLTTFAIMTLGGHTIVGLLRQAHEGRARATAKVQLPAE